MPGTAPLKGVRDHMSCQPPNDFAPCPEGAIPSASAEFLQELLERKEVSVPSILCLFRTFFFSEHFFWGVNVCLGGHVYHG